VALVAHEAYHTRQFREGLRRSEVQAERWAAQILESWREVRPAVVVRLRERRPAAGRGEPVPAALRSRQLALFDA
jgi:hypothetical protein